MTDNEIIKALECCRDNDNNLNMEKCFEECPYDGACAGNFMQDVLSLINRQKAEIKGLRDEVEHYERKRYIYTIPDIPPSLNKYAGRENVWEYRADKKQWEALCAVYCRPKPETPIKKCVVRITYFFSTMQRHDPDNYSGKFILDGLREAGIIEDDSFSNVELHLCGNYDKENPRTEIEVML